MRIGIDFDGTLVNSHADVPNRLEPLPGAREWLEAMNRRGHILILFSARAVEVQEVAFLWHWLRSNKLDHLIDSITATKLYEFDWFVDDRAVPFDGTYPDPEQFEQRKPWWKRQHGTAATASDCKSDTVETS